MAYRDKRNRLCGFLNIESEQSKGNFSRNYFMLDTEDGKLKIFHDSPTNLPRTASGPWKEINLNFISMVSDARKLRPKASFCFSVTNAGSQLFIQANNEEDMLLWIKSLNEACRITIPISEAPKSVPAASRTEVVGDGVIIQVPREQTSDSEDSTDQNLPALSLPSVLSGYATKQGLKRKNWKKRFFVLDTNGFSYYKADQDKEPIRTIPLTEIVQAKDVGGSHHPHRAHLFELVTPNRTFNVQCDTAVDCSKWITEINKLVSTAHRKEQYTEAAGDTDSAKCRKNILQEEKNPSSKAVWV